MQAQIEAPICLSYAQLMSCLTSTSSLHHLIKHDVRWLAAWFITQDSNAITRTQGARLDQLRMLVLLSGSRLPRLVCAATADGGDGRAHAAS